MEDSPSQSPLRIPRNYDGHHALFYRRHFESREDTRELRNHQVMIIPMNRYDHGSSVRRKNKDGLHHDKDIYPLSHEIDGTRALPNELFVKIVLALCDINEPLHMSHVDRFRNVRDELDALSQDEFVDKETRKQAWRYANNFSQQLEYMMRRPLKGEEYWHWQYVSPSSSDK